MEFTATANGQAKKIAAFLEQRFRVASDAPFLQSSLLSWKYYEPGPAWPGSRSYVLLNGGQILAHAAVWPVQLQVNGRIRSGISFIDWAASEDHPGIGLLLVKRLMALTPFTLVTGGAEITREILPLMGFKPWASLPVYARVLRPFHQLRTRPSHAGWREPARLLRNVCWSRKSVTSVGDWTADIAAEPDEQALYAVQGQRGSVHSSEFLRFMTRCPTVPVRLITLHKAGAARGYAVVSVVAGQARIACARIASENERDWQQAVAAITTTIKRDRKVCELVAVGSTPSLESALQANGFHLRERRPLVVFDAEGQLADEPVPPLGMLEDDASFLHVPTYPYLT